jgi:hypothetical protein
MKTYNITILTKKGTVIVQYTNNTPIKEFENKVLAEHGTFMTVKAEQI